MANFDGWNLVILLVAAYFAIVTLVRLMRRRRDEVVMELQKEVEAEKHRVNQQQSKQRTRRRPHSAE